MEVGELDGETVLVVLHRRVGRWEPAHPVRIRAAGGVIARIADYYACPWVVAEATSVLVA